MVLGAREDGELFSEVLGADTERLPGVTGTCLAISLTLEPAANVASLSLVVCMSSNVKTDTLQITHGITQNVTTNSIFNVLQL